MTEKIQRIENISGLINNEKFNKFAGYFINQPKSISNVAKLSHVSRPTIYVYLKILDDLKGNYIKHGVLFGGERISIDIKLLTDYLSKIAKLNANEKLLLVRLFSESIVRRIVLKWYGTGNVSELIKRTTLCIAMLSTMAEQIEEKRDPIIRFGVANILILGRGDIDQLDSVLNGLSKNQSKTLSKLSRKLSRIPDSFNLIPPDFLVQTLLGYRNISGALQALSEKQRKQIETTLWDNYTATS